MSDTYTEADLLSELGLIEDRDEIVKELRALRKRRIASLYIGQPVTIRDIRPKKWDGTVGVITEIKRHGKRNAVGEVSVTTAAGTIEGFPPVCIFPSLPER